MALWKQTMADSIAPAAAGTGTIPAPPWKSIAAFAGVGDIIGTATMHILPVTIRGWARTRRRHHFAIEYVGIPEERVEGLTTTVQADCGKEVRCCQLV